MATENMLLENPDDEFLIESAKNEDKLVTEIAQLVSQSVEEERLKHCIHENTKVNGFGTKRYCCECEVELPLDFGKNY